MRPDSHGAAISLKERFLRPLDRAFNHWDAIKLLALALMFVDHTGHYFLQDEQWLRAIGRSCAPIFLFLAGFAGSYRFRLSLLLFAVAVQLSDYLQFFAFHSFNILFSILICRMIFDWLEKRGKVIERPWEWFIGSLALVGIIIFIQYGSFGILFAVSGYMMKYKARYSDRTRFWFLVLSTAAYGAVSIGLFEFDLANTLLMSAFLCVMVYLLLNVDKEPVAPSWMSPRALQIAKAVSAYSLYIYGLHVMLFSWISGQSL